MQANFIPTEIPAITEEGTFPGLLKGHQGHESPPLGVSVVIPSLKLQSSLSSLQKMSSVSILTKWEPGAGLGMAGWGQAGDSSEERHRRSSQLESALWGVLANSEGEPCAP